MRRGPAKSSAHRPQADLHLEIEEEELWDYFHSDHIFGVLQTTLPGTDSTGVCEIDYLVTENKNVLFFYLLVDQHKNEEM